MRPGPSSVPRQPLAVHIQHSFSLFRYLVSRDGGTVSFFEAGVEPVTLQPLIQQLLLE
jgi:glutathione peroxidase-family protein